MFIFTETYLTLVVLFQQKAKDHFGIDGDEESTMYEDSVSPAKYVMSCLCFA